MVAYLVHTPNLCDLMLVVSSRKIQLGEGLCSHVGYGGVPLHNLISKEREEWKGKERRGVKEKKRDVEGQHTK